MLLLIEETPPRVKDLRGKIFGNLEVTGLLLEKGDRGYKWLCKCKCGKGHISYGPELRSGQSKSCGCGMYKGRPKDITGKKRGELTAIESTGKKSGNGDYIWKFLCDCGKFCERTIGNFNGKTGNQRCGDCHEKKTIEMCKERKTHGFHKDHKTYKAWCKIKERCYNKNSKDYETYGARGIQMEADMREDFLLFYAEVGEAPKDGQRWSIDRIDHTKDYEKGNMRWATDVQQARNKGKMKNNTSGITGVHWEEKVHPNGKNSTTYAVAQWKEYDSFGNQILKKTSFSEKKLGLLLAFAEATKHRKEAISKLNGLGYGYAENHGE